ncbi:MAG TPA: hypothetical protein VJ506_02550, partial [Candidatus Limnocylindrales bacterium]|nr:hypothetical protein [Candidatus Limnocylindrales bacterium]
MTATARALAGPRTRRPTRQATSDALGERVVLWDNANIVESFPEITLPLTFSVAVELYAAVYVGVCRALGVPASTLERESAAFEELLGILQGRVYYNVNNWYRVLSLLPAFALASGFLEAMMGARRPGARADEHAVLEVAPPAPPRIRLAMTARLLHRMVRLESDTARFQRRLATVLARHRVVTARGQAGGSRAPSSTAAHGASSAPEAALVEFDAL